MDKNYYDILGVQKTASPDELKKAYRKLANEHHPDKGGDAEKFKEINEAYSILSDGNKRKEYDNPGFRFPNFGGMGEPGNPFSGFNMHFGNSMRQGPPKARPTKGGDLKFVFETPLSNFVFGGNLSLNLSYEEACSTCNGKGYTDAIKCDLCDGLGSRVEVKSGQGVYMQTVVPCSKCNGDGEISNNDCTTCSGSGRQEVKNRMFDIRVEPGFRDGQVIVQRGIGRKGIYGGPDGDLYVKLKMILPNPDSLTEKQRKVLEEL